MIYQKYFDPLFFLLFFGLVKSNKIENIFLKNKVFIHNRKLFFNFLLIFINVLQRKFFINYEHYKHRDALLQKI